MKNLEPRCAALVLILACGVLTTPVHAQSRASAADAADPALVLVSQHGILLDDASLPWSRRQASELLETLRAIPRAASEASSPSRWELVGKLGDDIEVDDEGARVRISAEAFGYASARSAELDGEQGVLTSLRLRHALLRFVTDGGRDLEAVELVLQERFGISTVVPDHAALTASTTGESAAHFQPFRPGELLLLLEQLEELPPTMRRVPGLDYLVRRADGTRGPFSSAPAVAWTSAGYIVFAEKAFVQASVDDVQRLILHEVAHFLWEFELSDDQRGAWAELGGWRENRRDPDRWSTSDETGFVNAYAHARNPDEDLSECVAHYVMNPARLRARSPAKYEFLKESLLAGSTYVARIDPALTFAVESPEPDREAPGRIRCVNVSQQGAPETDKVVSVEVELVTEDAVHGGAEGARMRVFSEVGTYVDVRLLPSDDSRSVLTGSFELSRHAKSGPWRASQIVLHDAVGNQRFCDADDFRFEIHVDSPLEDLTAPRYVPGSAVLSVTGDEHSESRVVRAEWRFEEDRPMRSGFATLALLGGSTRSLQAPASFDEASGRCVAEWPITDQHPAGTYELAFLSMTDVAGNQGKANLSGLESGAPSVTLLTSDPDLQAPELDLDALEVSARPLRPDAPDGATLVTIVYNVRDDKSGLGTVSYKLRDPNGGEHFDYHYHENFYTETFEGQPQAWKSYEIQVVLPVGSAPGTWGVSSMHTADKVGNERYHDFVEILHFEVQDDSDRVGP